MIEGLRLQTEGWVSRVRCFGLYHRHDKLTIGVDRVPSYTNKQLTYLPVPFVVIGVKCLHFCPTSSHSQPD